VNGQHYAALLPGKEPRYPWKKRLRGPQNRSGNFREENDFLLPGFEPPTVQSVV